MQRSLSPEGAEKANRIEMRPTHQPGAMQVNASPISSLWYRWLPCSLMNSSFLGCIISFPGWPFYACRTFGADISHAFRLPSSIPGDCLCSISGPVLASACALVPSPLSVASQHSLSSASRPSFSTPVGLHLTLAYLGPLDVRPFPTLFLNRCSHPP